MAVSGSFPIFPQRPSVTLRPDRGAGLVSFFNFPRLDRSSEKWRATPRVFARNHIHPRPTVSAGNEWRRSPCSLLPRFGNRVPAALLSPNSRATTSPSGVRRRSLQTLQCRVPPQSAYYLASHQELCVARQGFWACIAWGFLPSGFCDLTLRSSARARPSSISLASVDQRAPLGFSTRTR